MSETGDFWGGLEECLAKVKEQVRLSRGEGDGGQLKTHLSMSLTVSSE